MVTRFNASCLQLVIHGCDSGLISVEVEFSVNRIGAKSASYILAVILFCKANSGWEARGADQMLLLNWLDHSPLQKSGREAGPRP